jgi:hypothetical protein
MVAGPLTPSEGHPTPVAWLVFLIVPLFMCFAGIVVARSWPVKIALLAESITILIEASEAELADSSGKCVTVNSRFAEPPVRAKISWPLVWWAKGANSRAISRS